MGQLTAFNRYQKFDLIQLKFISNVKAIDYPAENKKCFFFIFRGLQMSILLRRLQMSIGINYSQYRSRQRNSAYQCEQQKILKYGDTFCDGAMAESIREDHELSTLRRSQQLA